MQINIFHNSWTLPNLLLSMQHIYMQYYYLLPPPLSSLCFEVLLVVGRAIYTVIGTRRLPWGPRPKRLDANSRLIIRLLPSVTFCDEYSVLLNMGQYPHLTYFDKLFVVNGVLSSSTTSLSVAFNSTLLNSAIFTSVPLYASDNS